MESHRVRLSPIVTQNKIKTYGNSASISNALGRIKLQD